MAIKTPKTLKTRPKTWMSWSCNLPARQLALSSCDTEKKVAMVINMWHVFFVGYISVYFSRGYNKFSFRKLEETLSKKIEG